MTLGTDITSAPTLPAGYTPSWCSWCSRWVGLPEDELVDAYQEHMDLCRPPEHQPTWDGPQA